MLSLQQFPCAQLFFGKSFNSGKIMGSIWANHWNTYGSGIKSLEIPNLIKFGLKTMNYAELWRKSSANGADLPVARALAGTLTRAFSFRLRFENFWNQALYICLDFWRFETHRKHCRVSLTESFSSESESQRCGTNYSIYFSNYFFIRLPENW